MVISEPALICLETSDDPFLRGFASLWFGPPDSVPTREYWGSHRAPVPARQAVAGIGPTAESYSEPFTAGCDGQYVRGEEQRVQNEEANDAGVPLTAQERRARSAALRGLLHGRQRRFEAAQAAFTEAARLDPELTLESVPTFWDMERGAHEAAVRAYTEAGRGSDASLLASRLRTTFRPRLVSPRRSAPSPAS